MDVEDPLLERLEDAWPNDPHVTGQHDDIGVGPSEHLGDRRVLAAGAERRSDPLLRRPLDRGPRPAAAPRVPAAGAEPPIDPPLRRPVERGARPVGEYQHDVATDLAAPRRLVERAPGGPWSPHAAGQ